MSSRQLRKLQQQRELELQQAKVQEAQDVPEEESEEEDTARTKAKPSLFANLAALEDEGDGDAEETFDHSDGEERGSQDDKEPVVVAKRPRATKSKKKKGKKGKNKASEQDDARAGETNGQSGDDIDIALRELNIKAAQSGTSVQEPAPLLDPEYERVCKLLGVNNQNLKVANEMRNLFGRTAADNHDDAGGAVPGRRNRRQRTNQQVDLETALKGHHLPGKGLPELTMRRNIFIQGKDEWPRATTGGLTMEVVDNQATDGTVEFRYVHDQAYNLIQQQFDALVEMGDPQNLIGLLQRHPYHISLLLQVSKIAKDQSDHSLCNDLVERALFTFARASLSNFSNKLAAGKVRLDFARPENRELWLAGYHYIKSLTMKGTYRTAFEWAKLLLSLDPEDDPYCMTLMLHHLALRCHEFDWLLEFSETDIYKKSAYAVCTDASLAYAAMQLKQPVKCRELLSKSISEMPWLFCKLFQELNLSDPPPSIWGQVPPTQPTTLLTELYIKQTKDLWNAPEAISLLMEVAHSLPAASSSTSDAIIARATINLDIARLIYLDNTPHLMSLVPSTLLHRQPNSDSDPLPPDHDHNLFSWPSQRRPFEESPSQQADAFSTFNNPINALRALLPRVARGEAEMPEDEEGLRRELGEVLTREETEGVLGDMHGAGEGLGGGFAGRALLALLGFARGAGNDGGTGMMEESLDDEDGAGESEDDDEFHDAEEHR